MPNAKNTPDSPAKRTVLVKNPETAEDLIVLALEKGGLQTVVRILRDWCGSREIRESLNMLHHRDPVNRFTHARRHAVEIYAKQHGLIPANLMVSIVGKNERADPEGSERYKLRMAREFLKNDEAALVGAKALASHWENNRPGKEDHGAYLKKLTRGFTFP